MKIKLKFLAILILATVLGLTSCKKEETPVTGPIYAIGDMGPSGVGIVFYITDGGTKGLEAAPALWYNGGPDPAVMWKTSDTSSPSTSHGIGDGYENTYTTMAGAEYPAAALCRSYNGGGKTDWYLPSLAESYELNKQKIIIGGFSDNYSIYWTSSLMMPENKPFATEVDIDNQIRWVALPKTNSALIRPIRSF